MTRLKIVSIHFLISLTIVSTVTLFTVNAWYPDIYARTEEFISLLWILAFVDVSLGPLLTAIVFKPNKKSLKFDLTIIALLQIAALSYGVATLFIARPVFIVFNIDRLTIVSAVDISEQELKKAPKQYQQFSYLQPILVGARQSSDPVEYERVLFMSLDGGADLPQLPQHYVPYKEMTEEVTKSLKSLESLFKKKPEIKNLIETSLLDLGISIDNVGFLPVIAKSIDTISIIDRKNAKILKYLPINSW